MEGTIRTMTQRRGAYGVRRSEEYWYSVGALVILACMAVVAGWLFMSALVPVDAETASAMMGR